ncbi:uncharacterized protein LOC127095843 [Lathyrus oleraceus]|uniref:uncharacterized protein LOC127095843 n=1 Tax=Pisum sativum TaxID=3888 RepID=UPI0021CED04F|nr:uncharacterized protein LOC127095843 [Pisum sativum]
MNSERGGNYKKKDVIAGSYTIKVKCPFMLRSVSSGRGWKVTVMCEFHNHILSKNLDGNDVLDRLKDHERNFVNDMTKCNMTPRYTVVALKNRDLENLTSVTNVYKARSTFQTSKRGYQIQGEPIPLELIHVFWKKLFIEEHKYIDDIINVEDDGNYGFRAIATLLGSALWVANLGVQGCEKWMTISDISYPIASR